MQLILQLSVYFVSWILFESSLYIYLVILDNIFADFFFSFLNCYSARDEKEVALCIKELNAPSFHPTMVSIWVTDSFDGKDMERDLLGKLLVNLAKSGDATLSRTHLVRG